MTVRLKTRMVVKPWGKDGLPPPFAAPDNQRIGEVWFEPPATLDALLVKYIFTSEALSVQVHPTDCHNVKSGQGLRGKDECWLILDAEPGAALGIGFREPLDQVAMRTAALDGSIERLLEWHPVSAGDFFYIPANTVHAVGAGISLVEIQQNSDVTYRLYDYGRPRELHLDKGIAVARGMAHPANLRSRIPGNGAATLVEGPQFRVDCLDGSVPPEVRQRYQAGPALVIPIQRTVSIAGEIIAAGECALAPSLDVVMLAEGAKVLVTQPV